MTKPKWTKIGKRSWRVEMGGQTFVLIKEEDGSTMLDHVIGPDMIVHVARFPSWDQAKGAALTALRTTQSMLDPHAVHTPSTPDPHPVQTKSMPVADALQIVLDVARMNLEPASTPVLAAERERQQTAIKVLEDYAVNVVSEGRDVQYCDNCGEVLKDDGVGYSELPFNVASANKGESAVICHDCDQKLAPKKNWRVSCVWQEMGNYYIEAADEDEAAQIAREEPLPRESSYVEDSFEIDSISEVKE